MMSGVRPLPTWMLAIITTLLYGVLMIYHDAVGSEIGALFSPLGRARYDQVMFLGGGVLIVIYAIFLTIKMQGNLTRRKTALFYLATTIIFAAAAIKYLLVIKIEMVHFIQYGLLSILVFLILRRYTLTALVIYLMALGDEAYQHWFIKHNKFAYYDFNDVWLNQIGMGFGLTTMYAIGMTIDRPNRPYLNRLLMVYAILIVVFVILWAIGVIGIWPADDGTLAPVQLMYEHLDGFWSKGWKHNVYHILRPLPGVLLHAGTIILYSLLDQAPQGARLST